MREKIECDYFTDECMLKSCTDCPSNKNEHPDCTDQQPTDDEKAVDLFFDYLDESGKLPENYKNWSLIMKSCYQDGVITAFKAQSAKLKEQVDEIQRLSSLLSEAVEALEWYRDYTDNPFKAISALSKLKEGE